MVLTGTALATDTFDLGFTRGLSAVDEPFVSAERCGTCHVDEYRAWAASRHRVSHSNAIYLQGYIDEPLTFCVRCHSPLAEQVDEVRANRDWYLEQGPRAEGRSGAVRSAEPLADEGITCVVCHQRDGEIIATEDSGRSPHRVRVEPDFGTSALCGNCHEFEMFAMRPDGLHFTGELMQSTFTEWREWGGKQQCQDCHMPDGAHVFRGAHDREWLARSIRVRVRRGRLRIRSVGVGHEHPTGDLFRHMTVEADVGEGFEVLHRIGRTFEVVHDDNVVTKRLLENTSLIPGEWRDVVLPVGVRRWRVRYHYGSEYDEFRGIVGEGELVVTIAEGDLEGG